MAFVPHRPAVFPPLLLSFASPRTPESRDQAESPFPFVAFQVSQPYAQDHLASLLARHRLSLGRPLPRRRLLRPKMRMEYAQASHLFRQDHFHAFWTSHRLTTRCFADLALECIRDTGAARTIAASRPDGRSNRIGVSAIAKMEFQTSAVTTYASFEYSVFLDTALGDGCGSCCSDRVRWIRGLGHQCQFGVECGRRMWRRTGRQMWSSVQRPGEPEGEQENDFMQNGIDPVILTVHLRGKPEGEVL